MCTFCSCGGYNDRLGGGSLTVGLPKRAKPPMKFFLINKGVDQYTITKLRKILFETHRIASYAWREDEIMKDPHIFNNVIDYHLQWSSGIVFICIGKSADCISCFAQKIEAETIENPTIISLNLQKLVEEGIDVDHNSLADILAPILLSLF